MKRFVFFLMFLGIASASITISFAVGTHTICLGDSTTLTWSSQNTASCSGIGATSCSFEASTGGSKGPFTPTSVGSCTSTYTCSSVSDSATLNVIYDSTCCNKGAYVGKPYWNGSSCQQYDDAWCQASPRFYDVVTNPTAGYCGCTFPRTHAGGSCTCPPGTTWNNVLGAGATCTANAPTSCPNGLNISSYPSCTCPAGQNQSGSSCVVPAAVGCPASTEWWGNCGYPVGAMTSGQTGLNVSNNLAGYTGSANFSCSSNGTRTISSPTCSADAPAVPEATTPGACDKTAARNETNYGDTAHQPLCVGGNTLISNFVGPTGAGPTYTYTWNCLSPNGGTTASCSTSASCTNGATGSGNFPTCTPLAAPTAWISALPLSVANGVGTTLSWGSSNTTYCERSGVLQNGYTSGTAIGTSNAGILTSPLISTQQHLI